jgi:hypothetical protein
VADDTTASEAHADRVDRVILGYLEAVDAGRAPDRRALLARHPDLADDLRAFFADHDGVGRLTRPLRSAGAARPGDTADEAGPPPDDGPLPGPVGGYRPLRLLGAGGMGRVYEAEGPDGRRVALKLLAPHVADARAAVERFRQEGRLAGRVAHPRCVFVFKADAEAGRPYIAMELMSGTTLKDLVERDGPLPAGEAVARTLDVLDGLAEAHRAGVLHRDVKPANCYVEPDGRVKVGDFGLSRSLTVNLHLTRPGGFVGTPLFASPEQLRGEPLDPRTDVYSAAATLYYLLTGQAPFQGAEGASLVARVVSEAAPPPRGLRPDVPPALEAAVLRGLERQRERRFRDLDEFRAALLPLLPGRLSIAGVGLRLGAYILDTLPFTVAVAVWQLTVVGVEQLPSLPACLALGSPVFVYFWLGDGLWGGTPGKRLLGLRVTRADGCEAPGLWRGLVRTALFIGVFRVATSLGAGAALGGGDYVAQGLWQMAGGFLGLAACFSTLRARNGYRGLHDLASGTRVVQLPTVPRAEGGRRTTDSGPEPAPALLPAAAVGGLPREVGPFLVRGALRWGPDERLLLGEDPSLERLVWLRLRPADRGALPAVRKELARPTRPRWLAEGGKEGWHWDAFVAPAGEPLADLVARRGPLGWPATRPLLEQLAEELGAAADDGTLPGSLSLDQVWVHPPGRVQLLDGPAAGADLPDTDGPSLALLRQVAALALEGRAGETGRAARTVLPLHARAQLQRLTGERCPYARLAEARADLAATHDRRAALTPVLRALQLALASCFLLMGLAHMFGWSRTGTVVQLMTLDRDLVREAALRHALRDAEVREALLREPGAEALRGDPDGFCDLLERRQAEDRTELATRLRGLGVFRSLFRVLPVIRARLDHGVGDEGLRFDPAPGPPGAFRISRTDVPEEPAGVDAPAALAGEVTHFQQPRPDAVARRARGALVGGAIILCIYPVLWAVWAFAFRGGLSLRLAGLALVRAGGADAWRLQCAWRALVVWAPVALLLWLAVWADVCHPALAWLCALPQGLTLLLLAGYVALALRFPGRGPHDRLAGTYLVPR